MAFDFQTDRKVDFTPLIELAPTQNTLISSLGIFESYNHATTEIRVDRDVSSDKLIPARVRGGERNWLTTPGLNGVAVTIPFFPLDHNIKAQDIQSFLDFLNPDADRLTTQEQVVNRYLNQIRRNVAFTKERILADAVMGRAYVGQDADGFQSQNQNYNWYDVFGVTQQSISIDFTSTTVDPTEVIEAQARGYIIDNKQDGSTVSNIIALCGRQFFSRIISSPFVRSAFTYYQGTPNPIRDRIGGNLDARVWNFKGVTYIEDIHNNVPTNEAFVFPEGISNMFQEHFAPADAYAYANQLAQDFYLFLINTDWRVMSMQSEFGMLAVNTRPELVVRLTTA